MAGQLQVSKANVSKGMAVGWRSVGDFFLNMFQGRFIVFSVIKDDALYRYLGR